MYNLSSGCPEIDNAAILNRIISERYTDLFEVLSERGYRILSSPVQCGVKTLYTVLYEAQNSRRTLVVYNKLNTAYSEALHDHIIREARFLMEMDHPAIEKVYAYWENDVLLCVIREHIEGESLTALRSKTRNVSEETVYRWARELCDVLQYAHTHFPFLMYPALNPEHILVQRDGTLKMVAFTYLLSERHGDSTPAHYGYYAPEAFGWEEHCDIRTDIYALGAVLYYMATGKSPSEPPYEIKEIRQYNPDFSTHLELLIQRCTKTDPDKRFQTCEALMSMIRQTPR